jgi:putative NADH-flavin reductase
MRLALFGATGRAAGAILRQARAAGCEVHALTRSPGKLNRDDPQVTVTAADTRDLAATGRAVHGADAVVSAIGGTGPGNPAVLQQGTAAILTAMNRVVFFAPGEAASAAARGPRGFPRDDDRAWNVEDVTVYEQVTSA